MRISTTDPITLRDVADLENRPFILQGEGDSALKIYFESEETKRTFLDIPVEHPGEDFEHNLDNPV